MLLERLPQRLQSIHSGRTKTGEQHLRNIADSMLKLVTAGYQRDMRWQTPRRGRNRVLEQNTFSCQTIKGGRGLARVSISGNVVSAKRVNHDEQNIGRAAFGGGVIPEISFFGMAGSQANDAKNTHQ